VYTLNKQEHSFRWQGLNMEYAFTVTLNVADYLLLKDNPNDYACELAFGRARTDLFGAMRKAVQALTESWIGGLADLTIEPQFSHFVGDKVDTALAVWDVGITGPQDKVEQIRQHVVGG